MSRLRRGLAGLAIVTTVLTGAALQAGAETPHGAQRAVAAKAKKKKPVSTCKLLTVAEITQALGTAPTVPPKQDTVGECDYSSPADYNFINISVSALSTPDLWKQSAGGAGATVKVTGIGDAAFRSPTNATIMVRKGKKTLRIDQYVTGLSEAQIESLGKAATARL
jgi:hypothetical protein